MLLVKNIVPVAVGVIAGIICIEAGEKGIHFLYPLPAGTDISNRAALATAIAQVSSGVFMALIASYILSSFVAGIAASLVAGRENRVPAIIAGIVLTIIGMANAVMLPNPVWFKITNLFIYLPFAYLGYLVVRKKVTI